MKKFLVFILLFSSCLHSSGGNRFYKGFDSEKVRAKDPRIAQAIELQGKIATVQSKIVHCDDTLAIIRRTQSENEGKKQASDRIILHSSYKMIAEKRRREKQEVLMRGGEKHAETDQERRRFAQQRRINQNKIDMNESGIAIQVSVKNRFYKESERVLSWEKSDLEAERLDQLRQKMNHEQELKTLLNGKTVFGLMVPAMVAVEKDEIRESKQKKSAVFQQMKQQHEQKELAKNRALHQQVVAEIKQREVAKQQAAVVQRQAEEEAGKQARIAVHQEVVAEIKQREVARQQLATAQRQAEERARQQEAKRLAAIAQRQAKEELAKQQAAQEKEEAEEAAAAAVAKKKAAKKAARKRQRAKQAAKEKKEAEEKEAFAAALKESTCKDKSTVDLKGQGAAAELDQGSHGQQEVKNRGLVEDQDRKAELEYLKTLPKNMSMAEKQHEMQEFRRIQAIERSMEENKARKDYTQSAGKKIVTVEIDHDRMLSLIANSMHAVSSVIASTDQENLLALHTLSRAFKVIKDGFCCDGIDLPQYPGVAELQLEIGKALIVFGDRIEQGDQVKQSKQAQTMLKKLQGVVSTSAFKQKASTAMDGSGSLSKQELLGATNHPLHQYMQLPSVSDQDLEMFRSNAQAAFDKHNRSEDDGEDFCRDILSACALFAEDYSFSNVFDKKFVIHAVNVAGGNMKFESLINLQQVTAEQVKHNPLARATFGIMDRMQMVLIDVLRRGR